MEGFDYGVIVHNSRHFLGLAGEQGFPVEPAGIIAQQSQVGLKPIDPGRLQS